MKKRGDTQTIKIARRAQETDTERVNEIKMQSVCLIVQTKLAAFKNINDYIQNACLSTVKDQSLTQPLNTKT